MFFEWLWKYSKEKYNDYHSDTLPDVLFGGGTDYPDIYEEHGWSVISTAFDKCCYVTVRLLPRFVDYTNQLTYARIEQLSSVDEV